MIICYWFLKQAKFYFSVIWKVEDNGNNILVTLVKIIFILRVSITQFKIDFYWIIFEVYYKFNLAVPFIHLLSLNFDGLYLVINKTASIKASNIVQNFVKIVRDIRCLDWTNLLYNVVHNKMLMQIKYKIIRVLQWRLRRMHNCKIN